MLEKPLSICSGSPSDDNNLCSNPPKIQELPLFEGSRVVMPSMGLTVLALPANSPLLEPDFLGASAVEGKGPHRPPYQIT